MKQTADAIVIGGGSAGCIVAARLAERADLRVLLLEAGPADEGNPAAMDLKRLDEQTADDDWGFTATTVQGGTAQLKYARAKMLGGCANHNDCAFIRPPDSDFVEWERLGAMGWGPSAMAPMWEKLQTRLTIETCALNPFSQAFIAAGQALGLPLRDFRKEMAEGVGPFPLNAKGRQRHSSSVRYLHPLTQLPDNLTVQTDVTVERILFEGRRAIGVATSAGEIMARHVILAAGAIQTPQLLMLSGIGPANHLVSHAIKVLHDNPHVGAHLKDHVAAPIVWSTKQHVGDWDICPFEATMMLHLDKAEPAPDILFHFGLRVREKYVQGERFPHVGDAVKASPNVTRARSEGRITLSGPTVYDKPKIDLNYFSDQYDLCKLVQALKFTRQLIETNPLSSLLQEELYPGPMVQTDAEWEAYIRDVCETVYHPCGTARIGEVVDTNLRVKGVENLSVVDASVHPSLITVNINAAVMMVAERAATLLAHAL